MPAFWASRAAVPKAQAPSWLSQRARGAWEPPPVLLPLQEVLPGKHPPPTEASLPPHTYKAGLRFLSHEPLTVHVMKRLPSPTVLSREGGCVLALATEAGFFWNSLENWVTEPPLENSPVLPKDLPFLKSVVCAAVLV